MSSAATPRRGWDVESQWHEISRADRIHILDGDNSAESTVVDMTAFYVVVRDEEDRLISCPNSLAVQKAIRNAGPGAP